MVKIAVLGYGTVGSGVVEVINTNSALINKRVGEELEIKYVLDLSFSFHQNSTKCIHQRDHPLENTPLYFVR